MRHLEVDAAAASRWPLVKMMHGYFGTCISGHKAFGFPHVEPCSRRCGLACLALYAPRKCGTLRPEALLSQYTWTRRQQHLLPLYRALVVASEHMRHEYTAHGVEADRVHAIPLFTPPTLERRERATSRPQASIDVLFLGRMTPLKGADVLLDACAVAARHLGRTIHLVLAGEGPLRSALDRGRPGVSVDLPGWVDARRRSELLGAALIAAVPSRWPEPFGLVGLEAFAAGVPAVAFDVGGIATWLQDGINGRLADPSGGAAAFGAALAAILSDPAERERLARGARDTASRFDVDRHTQALEHVLESARTR
jgi:glycosyltransferase involved in cell wall biosynthesis